jgi:hypothetical protein
MYIEMKKLEKLYKALFYIENKNNSKTCLFFVQSCSIIISPDSFFSFDTEVKQLAHGSNRAIPLSPY